MALAVLAVIWLALAGICVLKGKPWFAALGVLALGPLSLIGAIRLAKPDSYWAERWYGPHTLEAACQRFPKSADRLELPKAA